MYFKSQKFFVAGISKSGEGCAKFLLDKGAKVFVYDDLMAANVQENLINLQKLGAEIVEKESLEEAIRQSDILILSPGIPIDHSLPIAFRRQGKVIMGEEELASLFLRATAIAVTGTNGKTTTVSMIHDILSQANKNSVLCGNIGNPLINEVETLTFDDYTVLEISSFQLETLYSLRPHIAIITNISEDHLNRHYNMENYIFLKSKLIRNLKESEFAVLNYDDEKVREMSQLTKAQVVYFSMNRRVNGAYYEGGYICYEGERIVDTNQMLVEGTHNIYNALASVTAAILIGVNVEEIKVAISGFKGVKHRIEKVGEVHGVSYIDDSKGTNVDASIKAIESMRSSTILLLGGKDKGYDYSPLFANLKNSIVEHVIIYGENRFKIMDDAIHANFLSFSLCAEFEAAVRLSRFIAKSGQCVLLSPASASFDSFANYEERGEKFAELVNSFIQEKAQ